MIIRKNKAKHDWRRWFAWYPVEINSDGDKAWLQWVLWIEDYGWDLSMLGKGYGHGMKSYGWVYYRLPD